MLLNPTPGTPYQTAWLPAFSELSFPSISTPPYWRTLASIEAYSASELWKDAARVMNVLARVSELLFEEPMLYRLRSPSMCELYVCVYLVCRFSLVLNAR